MGMKELLVDSQHLKTIFRSGELPDFAISLLLLSFGKAHAYLAHACAQVPLFATMQEQRNYSTDAKCRKWCAFVPNLPSQYHKKRVNRLQDLQPSRQVCVQAYSRRGNGPGAVSEEKCVHKQN